MVQRNRQGREIWFERWLWSHMPCHWKGWLAIAGCLLTTLALLWLLIWLLHPSDGDVRPFLVLPIGVVVMHILAERHSPSETK